MYLAVRTVKLVLEGKAFKSPYLEVVTSSRTVFVPVVEVVGV